MYATVHRIKVFQKTANLNYLLRPTSVFAKKNILPDFLGVPDFFPHCIYFQYNLQVFCFYKTLDPLNLLMYRILSNESTLVAVIRSFLTASPTYFTLNCTFRHPQLFNAIWCPPGTAADSPNLPI